MAAALAKILDEALTLPPKERTKLASELLASVDDEGEPEADVEVAWAEEIDRRLDQYMGGEVKGIDADLVHADIEARLRSRRAG